jgi:hypothetical protein
VSVPSITWELSDVENGRGVLWGMFVTPSVPSFLTF